MAYFSHFPDEMQRWRIKNAARTLTKNMEMSKAGML